MHPSRISSSPSRFVRYGALFLFAAAFLAGGTVTSATWNPGGGNKGNGHSQSSNGKGHSHKHDPKKCYSKHDGYVHDACSDGWYYHDKKAKTWYSFDAWKQVWTWFCNDKDFDWKDDEVEEQCYPYAEACLTDQGSGYYYDECADLWYYKLLVIWYVEDGNDWKCLGWTDPFAGQEYCEEVSSETPGNGGEEDCGLYPITFPVTTLNSLSVGQSFDIYAGKNPGNFGWLTWAGSPSEPTIQQSLVIPGDSYTYVNPYDSSDTVLSAGDWVQGKPGISNSKGVRDNLDKLINVPIRIPVYGQVTGAGNNVNYEIVAFAEVAIQSYRLPSQNRITAKFLGFANCGGPVNTPPTADDKQAATDTGIPVSVTLSGDDVDGDALTFEIASQPSNGSVTLSGSTATYTSTHGFAGVDTFTYVAHDGSAASEPATVTVTVIQPNRPPVAVSKQFEIFQNEPVDVLLEGSDPDGDSLTYTLESLPTYGTLEDLGGGLYSYAPYPGFLGEDSFTYTAFDGDVSSGIATVTILVGCAPAPTQAGTFWSELPAVINGRVEGPLVHLKGEAFTLNSSAVITGDVFVPGTPKLKLNGKPNFGGTLQGNGSTHPKNYQVTINSGASLGHLVTRSDPPSMPNVSSPSSPHWLQFISVTINKASESDPSFTLLRNLTLNSNVGMRSVPAGAYGDFTANSGSGFVLGTPGATTPAVYSFQNLRINSGARLDVVGPVIVRVNSDISLNGPAGAEGHPEWLVVELHQHSFTVNSGNAVHAKVFAPKGEVTVNGNASVSGDIYAKRIRVNSGGLITGGSLASGADCTNEPPVAQDRAATTPKGTSVAVTLIGVDPEGAPISYLLVDAPANGSVSLSGDTATYSPAAGFAGADAFTYQVSDGQMLSNVATVSVTVLNAAPVAQNVSAETLKNTPVSLPLTATDPDGDSLSLTLVNLPQNGTAVLEGGVVTYTPNAGFAGVDSFTYRASDGIAQSNVATGAITVRNQAPSADAKAAETQAGSPVAVTLTGSDPDSDSLSFELVSGPSAGTVSIDGAQATYTPSAGFSGVVTFTYRSFDGHDHSAPATVTITVIQPNRPPEAVSLSVETDFETAVDIILEGSDPDGDSLTFTIESLPAHGTLVDLGGGMVEYVPDARFLGEDSFTYTVSDDEFTSALAVVTILVICPDAGSAGDGFFWSQYPASIDGTVEGSLYHLTAQGFNLNSTANISGDILVPGTPNVNVNGTPNWEGVIEGEGSASPSGYWITINSGATLRNLVTRTDPQPLPDVTAPTAPANHSWISINNASDPDPNWSTVGNVNFNSNSGIRAVPAGAYGSFNLNGGTGIILGTVGATTPEVYSFQQLNVNTGARIDVVGPVIVRLANNTSWNGPAGAEGHSEWLVIEVNNGGFTANSQGQTIYAHVYAPRGEITVNNNSTLCGTAYGQRIRVNSGGLLTYCGPTGDGCITNQAPVAEDIVTATPRETPIDITLFGSDPDGDAITYALVDQPANGTASLIGDLATYTPDAGFVGTDTFTYRVNDGELDSHLATVTITVTNGAPAAFDDAVTIPKNSIADITLTAVDPEGDPLTYAIVSSPANGTVSITGNVATYTPNTGFSGTDSFTFVANDGFENSNVATVTVTVTNQLPSAQNVSATTPKNTPVNLTLLGSDPDGDPLTYSIVTQPANGSVTVTGSTARYTPPAGFTGTATFTYLANDGLGNSNVATGTVTVQNRRPTADSKSVQAQYNAPTDIVLTGMDPDGDPITFTVLTQPSFGTLEILEFVNDVVVYTPAPGSFGRDSFTYISTDGELNSMVATVTIIIPNNNLPPVVKPIVRETPMETPIDIVLQGSDPNGDELSYQIVQQPSNGSVVVNGDTVTYTPNFGFVGNDWFTYRASDGVLFSGNARVDIAVLGPVGNQPPVVEDMYFEILPGVLLTISLTGFDPDGDSLQFITVSSPANGLMFQTGPSTYIYLPNSGFTGTDSFQYLAWDGQAVSNFGTITIVVGAPGNQPPVVDAGPDHVYLIDELLDSGGVVRFNLNGTVTDDGLPSPTALASNWTLVSAPAGASVQIQSPGSAGTGIAVTNPAFGNYVFRLTADDTEYIVFDQVRVRLQPENLPPVVTTELQMTVDQVDTEVVIWGSVEDDGLPSLEALTHEWAVLHGPSALSQEQLDAIITSDPAQKIITASFPLPGIYLLMLGGDDTEYEDSEVLVVYVAIDCLIETPGTAIAWWPANLSTQDYIERRHRGLGAGELAYTDGKVSLGFLFNGVDTRIFAPRSVVSDVAAPLNGGFSVEGWISPDQLATMPLFKWSDGVVAGVTLSMNASGSLNLRLPIVGGSVITRSYPGIFIAGEFTHIAVTYNHAAGTLRVYRNGILVGLEALGSFRFDTRFDMWIGYSAEADPAYFRGVIDELTVYRGTLTPSQVQLIFQSQDIGKCGNPDDI